jgi:hypothetical protein
MLEPDLIESKAIRGLSGKALLTLIRFHQKAHRKRTGKRQKGMKDMIITNNGEIIFTYAEAEELGISKATFFRVLRELIENRGFIDVAKRGHYQGEPTKFAISDRWKRFGTDQYKRVKFERVLPRGMGFQSKCKNNPRYQK